LRRIKARATSGAAKGAARANIDSPQIPAAACRPFGVAGVPARTVQRQLRSRANSTLTCRNGRAHRLLKEVQRSRKQEQTAMANVTFSSETMPRDVTVYAIAGDRGNLLSLAKAHRIPIPFDCQDGECGSCLVEIRHAEVNDMPPKFRLACQCFVRNEDIIVTFEGDKTLPVKGPTLSIAAAVYKGGVQVKTLDDFLSYAVKVEEDAAVHFEKLAQSMAECGNADVATLFQKLGRYSRLHLEEAKAKCSKHAVDVTLPASSAWPDNETPEKTTLWAGDPSLSRLGALKVALQGERRGFEFYYAIAGTTSDPEIRAVAKEFVREETEHVEELKRWIEQEDAALRAKA
jgi:rubrerythrin/ferredoxin